MYYEVLEEILRKKQNVIFEKNVIMHMKYTIKRN